jgi:hypothetical protein
MNTSKVSSSSYRPAELYIHLKAAEIEMDWRKVWDSMGLENPMSFMRSRNAAIRQEAVEAIGQKVRDGDRIAQSVKNKEQNVFGNIALEKHLRERTPVTQLVAMPSTGPNIEITTYRPDIQIIAHSPALSGSKTKLSTMTTVQSSFVNTKV